MKKYTKRRPSRKQKLDENSVAIGNSRREPLAVYYGQRLLGSFVENERSGFVLAWDAQHKRLGRFGNAEAAADAISDAARAADAKKAATRKTLERLNRPDPEFASGLPADLVGGGRR
jgi:hypothetical protein